VIAQAWQSGHTGKVVITSSTDNSLYTWLIRGLSGLKITGLTFMDLRSPTQDINGFILVGDKDNGSYDDTHRIHFDDCHIIGENGVIGLLNFDATNFTVSNSTLEYLSNTNAAECDPLTVTYAGGTILYENNKIIQRNNASATDAHRDIIQFNFDSGLGSLVEIIIRNNVLIQDGDNSASWNAIIYNSISGIPTTKWYIYNNIMVSNTENSPIGGLFIYNSELDAGNSENFWVFNNTLIHSDDGTGASRPINIGNSGVDNHKCDTILQQNNLIVMDEPIDYVIDYPTFFQNPYYRKVDYNGYFESGGIGASTPFYTGEGFGAYDYETWQDFDDGNDVNSITGNSTSVTFDNKFGYDAEDYYTTTGRGAGVNIADAFPYLLDKFPDIMYDILGNPRPETGAWDMGALQYETGAVDTVPIFSFTALTGRELNTEYIATSPITGTDSITNFWTTTAAEFKINYNGTYNTSMKSANPDNGADTVYVKNTTGGSYSTTYTETIVAGGVSRNFNATTKAEPPVTTGGIARGSNGKIWRTSDGKIIKVQP